jgi:hypothetical protein
VPLLWYRRRFDWRRRCRRQKASIYLSAEGSRITNCPLMTQSGHWVVLNEPHLNRYDVAVLSVGGGNEAARVHIAFRWCDGGMAARGERATSEEIGTRWCVGGRFSSISVRRCLPARVAYPWLFGRSEYRARISLHDGAKRPRYRTCCRTGPPKCGCHRDALDPSDPSRDRSHKDHSHRYGGGRASAKRLR